jgi:hypothetical protein
MRNLLAVMLSGILLVAVAGCQDMNKDKTSTASADACAMCDGVQKMTTDGKCEKCMMSVDACSHCAGKQTMTANGTCPQCGMKVATK